MLAVCQIKTLNFQKIAHIQKQSVPFYHPLRWDNHLKAFFKFITAVSDCHVLEGKGSFEIDRKYCEVMINKWKQA